MLLTMYSYNGNNHSVQKVIPKMILFYFGQFYTIVVRNLFQFDILQSLQIQVIRKFINFRKKIQKMQKGYSAIVYGATGAVGRELIQQLLNSPKWSTVHVVVRRQLQQWTTHPNKAKLQIEVLKDMDQLLKPDQFKYKGFDSMFCLFGSQTKHGQQTFVKVDKTYPLAIADIALKNGIPHYLLCSSVGADEKSWFLYPRTKGEVERDLKTKKLPLLSIFRPGLLQNRHEARFMEKLGSFLPFFPKIEAKDAAKVMMRTAQRDIEKARKANSQVQLYENKQMLELLK